MKPLTAVQRKALHLAARKGGCQQGTVKGTIRAQVVRVLVEREWVTVSHGTVLITKAGRAKLAEPVPDDPPIFLAGAGSAKGEEDDESGRWDPTDHGYTTLAHRAIDDLEVMDPARLHPDWRLRAEAHRKLSRRDLDAARLSGLDPLDGRVAELRRMALERGRDIRGDLRQLEHVVRRIERKVTGEEADRAA